MTTLQAFKENDPVEAQMKAVLLAALAPLSSDRDAMYADCYNSYPLGDVLYDLERDPLSDVITRDVYRASFPAIHELFTAPGTFEFYLSVFRKIFPEDVDLQFAIPGPGKLTITVNSLTLEEFGLLARQIVDDLYIYSNLVTSNLNELIIGHGAKGIKTQSEMDALTVEISAYGIFTNVVLVT